MSDDTQARALIGDAADPRDAALDVLHVALDAVEQLHGDAEQALVARLYRLREQREAGERRTLTPPGRRREPLPHPVA